MENRVKLVVADVQQLQGKEEQILSQIAPCYAAKYKNTKIRRDALQELTAGYLLKRYLGVNKEEQLTYNACHKPLLVSGRAYFNLSHSADKVVLAIAGCDIGVDIEQIMDCHEATVKKMFSEKQKEELFELEGNAKNKKFTEMWTVHEAKLKLKGTGFEDSWEKIRQQIECSIYTIKMGDYYLSCATKEAAVIETEWL